MIIHNLPLGTVLMWDPKANDPITGKKIIYPARIGFKHPDYNSSKDRKWVKVFTPNNSNWMGPEEKNLRYPTQEELEKYVRPKIKY